MAEGLNDGQIDDVEQESQQKNEIKELRAKIQALKKSVAKGDKKRRKEVNVEIASLEKEIEQLRKCDHKADHKGSIDCADDPSSVPTANMDKITLSEHKKSKAQRKRDNKARKEKERDERIAKGLVKEEDTPRHQEMTRLLSLLEPLRLTIKDIAPDGNCLYTAFSDQLLQRTHTQTSVTDLREKCAEYIRTHSDDFIPYVTNPDTGDVCTTEEFNIYCDEIKNPSVWGGQIEIVALSRIYKSPVTVYQANAPPMVVSEEYNHDNMLHLSYHQFLYTLGKHYNSVVTIK